MGTQTFSEENYLKAIYHLCGKEEGKASATGIAEVLGNNPASVIDMLKKLTEKKLIQYDKKKGARLSEKGQKAALLVIRKHRLWEVFLQEKLGYTWDEVHDIAEQLEHIHHVDLADRLDKFLDYPKYDPHGDPIPKSNGQIPAASKTTLMEIEAGKTCQVVGVRDTSTPFLQYLQQLKVAIGTNITLMEKIVFDNSVIIKIGRGAATTVSQKFAESVLVI